jgi:hypothetical protein
MAYMLSKMKYRMGQVPNNYSHLWHEAGNAMPLFNSCPSYPEYFLKLLNNGEVNWDPIVWDSNESIELAKMLLGPHGWTIHKMLLARLEK